MAKRTTAAADIVLDAPDATLVDVLDHTLNKGVVATGDVMLGVAGVDLIYLRLSALLCAADRVWSGPSTRRSALSRRAGTAGGHAAPRARKRRGGRT
jgi:hypothetical protein